MSRPLLSGEYLLLLDAGVCGGSASLQEQSYVPSLYLQLPLHAGSYELHAALPDWSSEKKQGYFWEHHDAHSNCELHGEHARRDHLHADRSHQDPPKVLLQEGSLEKIKGESAAFLW